MEFTCQTIVFVIVTKASLPLKPFNTNINYINISINFNININFTMGICKLYLGSREIVKHIYYINVNC